MRASRSPPRRFAEASRTRWRKGCVASSAIVGGLLLAHRAGAQPVIDYPNGSTNASSIVLSTDTTQLQVLTGSATQSGIISETGGSRPIEKIGVGTLTLSGANTYTGATTITAGILQIGAGGTAGVLGTGSVVNNATLQINRSDATFTISNDMSGTGALIKTTAGTSTTLILTGTNTYSGTTTITEGILQIGAGGTMGTLGTGGVVTTGGTLRFNRSDALSVSGVISGTGTVSQFGAGTTTLTGANSYTGATTITTGALNIQNNTALGTTAAGTTVSSGAALEVQNNIAVGAEALSLNATFRAPTAWPAQSPWPAPLASIPTPAPSP